MGSATAGLSRSCEKERARASEARHSTIPMLTRLRAAPTGENNAAAVRIRRPRAWRNPADIQDETLPGGDRRSATCDPARPTAIVRPGRRLGPAPQRGLRMALRHQARRNTIDGDRRNDSMGSPDGDPTDEGETLDTRHDPSPADPEAAREGSAHSAPTGEVGSAGVGSGDRGWNDGVARRP